MKITKLRKSAKGRECTLQIVGICNYNPETTVLAHIDSEAKGMGYKSPDYFGVFACSDCHAALDQHKLTELDRLFYSNRGLLRTWAIWIDEGLIKI